MNDVSHAQLGLDSLHDRFAGRLDVGLPSAFREPQTEAASERAWIQGLEAERMRALELIRQLRAAADGPSLHAAAALHFGVTSCLDAAERWRTYYRGADMAPARFALLARAEVASRLACALRELADDPVSIAAA